MKKMSSFIFLTFIFPLSSFAADLQIVFMHEANQQKQIESSSPDGKNIQALTSPDVFSIYPDISSDGEWMAFSEGKDEQNLGIFIKNLKTSAKEQWVEGRGANLHSDISGDGQILAWSGPIGKDGKQQIGLIDLRAERKKGPSATRLEKNSIPVEVYSPIIKVIESESPCYFPAISSDGSFLVFQRNISDKIKEIVKLNLSSDPTIQDKNNHDLQILSQINEKAMSPSLSFDDRWAVFTQFINDNWDIYMVDLQSKKPVQIRLTTDNAKDFAPTFSPEGDIIFASDRSGSFQLYKISADSISSKTYEVQPLLQSTGTLYSPSVSGELEWKQNIFSSMTAPSRSSFGAVKNGDRIYVVGGHKGQGHNYPPESFLNTVEYFDLKTGTWHAAAPRPSVGHGFGLASYGKYIYAFGGFTYSSEHKPRWKSLDVIERYDTEKDEWTLVGHLPHARSSNVVAQIGTKVYLLAGWDSTPRFENDADGIFHRSVDVFNLETEKAESTSIELPDPLRRALTGVAYGKSIILIGGIGVGAKHFSLIDKVSVLNTETNEWSELPALPFATFAPAAEVLGDELLVFGGLHMTSPQDGAYTSHIFSLNLADKMATWKHTGRYLSESKGFSQVVKTDEKNLIILGGHAATATGDSPVLTVEGFSR